MFFDTAGIKWKYEQEGWIVDTYLGSIRYLPDFWIAGLQWGEVKGHLDPEGMHRLHALASAMAECNDGSDVVILGDIPRPQDSLWPVQLHNHGRLWGVPWSPEPGCPMNRPHVKIEPDRLNRERLTEGFPFGVPDWAQAGVVAARRARFEFGECG